MGFVRLGFSEASFNPLPIEPLLFLLCLAEPELSLWFALIATVGSVLGGCFGYYIGYLGERTILERFFAHDKIDKVHKMYQKWGALAVLIAGFSPIPYKLATISAGVFYIDFKQFTIASIIGRGGRFFIEGFLLMYFGHTIIALIEEYWDVVSIAVAVVLVIGYLVWRHYSKVSNRSNRVIAK